MRLWGHSFLKLQRGSRDPSPPGKARGKSHVAGFYVGGPAGAMAGVPAVGWNFRILFIIVSP